MKNWAGNQTYSTDVVAAPNSVEALQQVIRDASKVKAHGSRHSFNTIADTTGTIISLENFQQISEPNPETRTVTIGGGVRYGELAVRLQEAGWALHNLASLPHISVAGAIGTATHGSGYRNGNLSTAVVGLKFVDGRGDVHSFDESDPEALDSRIVHLGALGIIFELTLRIQPTFEIRQTVFENLPFQTGLEHLAFIAQLGYSVSLFTRWSGPVFDQVWVKSEVELPVPTEILGTLPATRKLHPLAELPSENCTDQLGEPGPWHQRLAHFKMEFTPSAGEELQSEYFVSLEDAPSALATLSALAPELARLVFVTEVRFIAADSLPMSPAYQRDVVGIHFTWKPLWAEVEPMLSLIETLLDPFNPCPHFGKLFTLPTERLKEVYPRLPEFAGLADEHDPHGKFRNDFLKNILG